eukprot:3512939-Pleurochrysis_carterae.AAC.2
MSLATRQIFTSRDDSVSLYMFIGDSTQMPERAFYGLVSWKTRRRAQRRARGTARRCQTRASPRTCRPAACRRRGPCPPVRASERSRVSQTRSPAMAPKTASCEHDTSSLVL